MLLRVLNRHIVTRSISKKRMVSAEGSNAGSEFLKHPQWLQDLLGGNDIVVFGRDSCPYCVNAKKLLSSEKLDFKFVLSTEGDLHQKLIDYTSFPTVPKVFLQGRFVGGFSDLSELHKQGKLENYKK